MFKPSPQEQAMHSVEGAGENIQNATHKAIDSIGKAVDQGIDRVREASCKLRDSAAKASEDTASYIRQDPVKSVLIAAATGAALMALVSLLTRSNRRD